MLQLTNTNVLLILVVIILVIVVYKRYTGDKNIEALTNQEQEIIDSINKTIVLPQFKDMDPIKLYAVFNNDMNYITDIMVKNNIPSDILKDPLKYPYIASYLFNKGVLQFKK